MSCRRRWWTATLAAEDRRFFASRRRSAGAGAGRAVATSASCASSRAARRSRSRSAKLLLARRSPGRVASVVAARCARRAGAAARASAHQARDPRAVPEPRALRQPDGRRGPGQPRVLRPRPVDADAGAGRVLAGPAAAALRRSTPIADRDAALAAPARRCSRGWRPQGLLTAAAAAEARHGAAARSRRDRRRRSWRRTSSRWCWRRSDGPRPLASRRRSTPTCRRDVRHHREPPRPADAGTAPRTSRWSCSTTRAASGSRGRARATTATPQHGGAIDGAVVAAAARLGAEAVHVRAAPSSRASRPPPSCPTSVALSRPPSRACSTARATTTALSAARCWRGGRWPDPRTSPRSRSLAARRAHAAALPRARRLHDARQNAGLLRPRLTLGNAEVRLDELVAAYAAFARGGTWREPIVRLQADAGAARSRPSDELVSPRDRVLDHRHPVRRRGARVHLRPRRQPRVPVPGGGEDRHVAGYHDNWTVGYTRDVTVGVWVGNFESHAAARLDRGDRRGPDLPCRDARAAVARGKPAGR